MADIKELLEKDANGLLPCPFCGKSHPETMPLERDGSGLFIKCNLVECVVRPMCSHPSKEEAVKLWNTRAYDAVQKDDAMLRHLLQLRQALKSLLFSHQHGAGCERWDEVKENAATIIEETEYYRIEK